MATPLNTFINIFSQGLSSTDSTIHLQKIVIPKIQRDYAQGREDPNIERVRIRFLDALYKAVTEKPIVLDFVYGDIDEDGIMTPLDGQQRLTTLFLLHWYAAKKDNISFEEYSFLNKFCYETRYSARSFCDKLVTFYPSFNQKLSEEITDQSWFPLNWKKDPTVASMLVMLDAIDEKFGSIPGIWEKLKNNAISFYFLPIKDMGLTDELYIKMNSRGKPLTQFEHFKAEFEREIKSVLDGKKASIILSKIDLDWTDMLWQYRGKDNIIDDEFLRYFKFICDVICYRDGNSPQDIGYDEFVLLKKYFSSECENAVENYCLLEEYFDCWNELCKKESPEDFLSRFISYSHEPKKIKAMGSINIFKDCLYNYSDRSGKKRTFPLSKFILLYAVICYLRNKRSISEEQFSRRLRIVNNLILNSEDEISDSVYRSSGNRMPSILVQTESIITAGKIDISIEKGLNSNQLKEEIDKLIWTETHPDDAEMLFELEDHKLLQGQISIIGIENSEHFENFKKLFSCDYDKIDCALMTKGFYPQTERNGWRRQFGSKSTESNIAWRNLFHLSRNSGFNDTKKALLSLLDDCSNYTNEELSKISSQYINDCENKSEFPLEYYYIKYDIFRPGSYGKYSLNPDSKYLISVMLTQTQWSSNTYIPYLKEADEKHLSRDHNGQRLVFDNCYIICEENAYVVCSISDDSEIERIVISQNESNVDTEDRIIKLKKYLASKNF